MRPKGTDTRRLSYRHVHVEQVGHIYERLLDHGAVRAGEVVVALRGRPGEEPEVALADLEAKQLSGSNALVALLTDKAAEDAGRKVGTKKQVERLLAEPIDPHLRASWLVNRRNSSSWAGVKRWASSSTTTTRRCRSASSAASRSAA